jgi:hypothetical protein
MGTLAMSAQEEIIKLALQVQGEADVKRLNKELETEKEALIKLGTAFGGLGTAQAQQDQAVVSQTRKLADLNAQFLAAEKASGGLSSGLAGAGQAGLQAGRIIQDFAQGGVGGILNNIEGAVQSLGLGPGLAGVLTIVGVAALAAKPLIEDFLKSLKTDDLDTFKTGIMRIEERIKELKKEPLKLATDVRELDLAEGQLKRIIEGKQFFDQLMGTQSKEEAASGKQIRELITENPENKAAFKSVRQEYINWAVGNDGEVKQLRDEIQAAQAYIDDPEIKVISTIRGSEGRDMTAAAKAAKQQTVDRASERLRLRKLELEKVAPAWFEQITKNAVQGTGDDMKNAQTTLAKQLRAVGAPGTEILASQIESNSPEKIKATIDDNKRWAGLAHQAKRWAKRAEEDRKEVEMLNKAGRENFEHGLDEQRREKEKEEKHIADKRKHKANQIAGAFDQAYEPELVEVARRNNENLEIYKQMTPTQRSAVRRQAEEQARLEREALRSERRNDRANAALMTPADRATLAEQRREEATRRKLLRVPSVPLDPDAMKAELENRVRESLIGRPDAQGGVIGRLDAAAAATQFINKLMEKLSAMQLGAAVGMPRPTSVTGGFKSVGMGPPQTSAANAANQALDGQLGVVGALGGLANVDAQLNAKVAMLFQGLRQVQRMNRANSRPGLNSGG